MEAILEQLKETTTTIIKINTIEPNFSYKNNLGVAVDKVQSAIKL